MFKKLVVTHFQSKPIDPKVLIVKFNSKLSIFTSICNCVGLVSINLNKKTVNHHVTMNYQEKIADYLRFSWSCLVMSTICYNIYYEHYEKTSKLQSGVQIAAIISYSARLISVALLLLGLHFETSNVDGFKEIIFCDVDLQRLGFRTNYDMEKTYMLKILAAGIVLFSVATFEEYKLNNNELTPFVRSFFALILPNIIWYLGLIQLALKLFMVKTRLKWMNGNMGKGRQILKDAESIEKVRKVLPRLNKIAIESTNGLVGLLILVSFQTFFSAILAQIYEFYKYVEEYEPFNKDLIVSWLVKVIIPCGKIYLMLEGGQQFTKEVQLTYDSFLKAKFVQFRNCLEENSYTVLERLAQLRWIQLFKGLFEVWAAKVFMKLRKSPFLAFFG